MSDAYALVVEGLEELNSLADLPQEIIRSAVQAVNKTADRGIAAASREIRRQVKFPAGYLAGKEGRLYVRQRATSGKVEAIITGRSRPTSLGRFVKGSINVRGAKRSLGVRVEVKPGSVQRLPGAFLIRLRSGADGSLNNMGVAVRTKNGRPPPGYKPVRLADNLWLLYGPSVNQVLFSTRNQGGVATEISPALVDFLEDEFNRLRALKL